MGGQGISSGATLAAVAKKMDEIPEVRHKMSILILI
jgi:uncharacterized protein YoaH (UPF0181 family)